MTPEQLAEARAWTALREWRCMPGMAVQNPSEWGAGHLRVADDVMLRGRFGPPPGWLPDVTDPATIGCLLALTREITGSLLTASDDLYPDETQGKSSVFLDSLPAGRIAFYGPTITAALLLACQAAEAARGEG